MFLPRLAKLAEWLGLATAFRIRDPTTGAYRFPFPSGTTAEQVSPFWRRKPLHERLAESGGMVERDGGPLDPRPPFETGIHGLARPRQWDAVVTVETALPGESASFVALPDGTLLVEEGSGELQPLADAVEAQLAPPYRAEAIKRDGDVWAVAANRVEVVELREDVGGDEIELAVQRDHHTLLVDGRQVFGSAPTLERLAADRHGEAWVVRAARLDGNLWEVRTAAL